MNFQSSKNLSFFFFNLKIFSSYLTSPSLLWKMNSVTCVGQQHKPVPNTPLLKICLVHEVYQVNKLKEFTT